MSWSCLLRQKCLLYKPCVLASAPCRELGAQQAEVLAELRYDLPATMRFHK